MGPPNVPTPRFMSARVMQEQVCFLGFFSLLEKFLKNQMNCGEMFFLIRHLSDVGYGHTRIICEITQIVLACGFFFFFFFSFFVRDEIILKGYKMQ